MKYLQGKKYSSYNNILIFVKIIAIFYLLEVKYLLSEISVFWKNRQIIFK